MFPSQSPTTQVDNFKFCKGVDTFDQDADKIRESIRILADIYHSELIL